MKTINYKVIFIIKTKLVPNFYLKAAIILLCLCVVGTANAHTSTLAPNNKIGQSQKVISGVTPQGLTSREWKDIQKQIVAKGYHAKIKSDGSLAASNNAHNWNIHYKKSGTTSLTPKNADNYSIDMKLTRLGYGSTAGFKSFNHPKEITHSDNITSYQWSPALREVWTNTAQSLEQWFILEERPYNNIDHQKLNLELSLNTNLSISQESDGLHLNNNQGTDITYSKLKVWDKNGIVLPSQMLLAGNTITLQIDDTHAQYPVTIDPIFQQQAYLKAFNTGGGDQFGWSVGVSGDTIVVGARLEDSSSTGVNSAPNEGASAAGAVYVFIRSGATWTQQAYLKAFNTGVGDSFGYSVAISGDTIVVGAINEASSSSGVDSTPNDGAFGAGAAYVFIRNGATWTQQAYLKAFNTGGGDLFGSSVAVSGDTIVVGAFREDSSSTGVNSASDEAAENAGAAYVFTRSGTTWTQQAYLKASNTGAGDQFGFSVSVSGDTVVVGANLEGSSSTGVNSTPNDAAVNAGASYVFIRNGTIWTQQSYLKAFNTGANDQFGNAVSVSVDTIVIGARFEASSSTGVDSTPNDLASSAGAAYVFIRNGATWIQQAYLKASNTDIFDQFGYSVAVSGDSIVVGALEEDSSSTGVDSTPDEGAGNAGAAYVFIWTGVSWIQQAYLKASNTGANDQFGNVVAILGDAVVVGALGEASSSIGVDSTPDDLASSAGAVYFYFRKPEIIFKDSFGD